MGFKDNAVAQHTFGQMPTLLAPARPVKGAHTRSHPDARQGPLKASTACKRSSVRYGKRECWAFTACGKPPREEMYIQCSSGLTTVSKKGSIKWRSRMRYNHAVDAAQTFSVRAHGSAFGSARRNTFDKRALGQRRAPRPDQPSGWSRSSRGAMGWCPSGT